MARVGRDEVEAAYFTLLRAREEEAALRRYGEYLESEHRRIQRFIADGDALDAHVDPKLRRRIAHTDDPVRQSLRSRRETIDGELDRLPERIEAATAFVSECEEELEQLRSSRRG
jgi:chromosome segregation ATPase